MNNGQNGCSIKGCSIISRSDRIWLRFLSLLAVLLIVPFGAHNARAQNFGINALAVSPDGKTLASAMLGKKLSVWRIKAGQVKLIKTLPLKVAGNGTPIAFSPDNRTLAVWFGKTQLWDTRTAKLRRMLNSHGATPVQFAFSADGSRVAGKTGSGKIIIWDAKTGNVVQVLNLGPDRNLYSHSHFGFLRFLPDGKMLMSDAGKEIAFWNIQTGQIIRSRGLDTKFLPNPLWGSVNPDCTLAASQTGAGNPLRIWNLQTRKQRFALSQRGAINTGSFSPDGKKLVTSDNGTLLKLWNGATGKLLRAWKVKGAGRIEVVQFTPDGHRIITGHSDGAIHLWRI